MVESEIRCRAFCPFSLDERDDVRTIGEEVAVAPIHRCVSMFLRIAQINDPTRITWLTEMHLALRLFR